MYKKRPYKNLGHSLPCFLKRRTYDPLIFKIPCKRHWKDINFRCLFLVFFVRNLKKQGKVIKSWLVRNLKTQWKVIESWCLFDVFLDWILKMRGLRQTGTIWESGYVSKITLSLSWLNPKSTVMNKIQSKMEFASRLFQIVKTDK